MQMYVGDVRLAAASWRFLAWRFGPRFCEFFDFCFYCRRKIFKREPFVFGHNDDPLRETIQHRKRAKICNFPPMAANERWQQPRFVSPARLADSFRGEYNYAIRPLWPKQ